MKLSFFVRTPQVKGRRIKVDWDKQTPIYIRVADKGVVDQKAKTEISVPVGVWNNKRGGIDRNIVCQAEFVTDIETKVIKLSEYVSNAYAMAAGAIPPKWLNQTLKAFYSIAEESIEKQDTFPEFSELFDEFLRDHTVGSTQRHLSDSRSRQYLVVKRMIQRFELYRTAISGSPYSFDVRKITTDDLYALHEYAAKEDKIFVEQPEIFASIPEKRPPKPRCKNTLADLFNKKIKCFLNWCVDKDYIERSPYREFKIDPEMYGSIYYLEWEELEKIKNTNIPGDEKIQLAKDHMLVQAGIGCRVGDLMRLEKSNVYGGFIHYIPQKGIHSNPETVTVPVLDFVQEVIDKYADTSGPLLLPKMMEQEYNELIRHILTIAKITRNVTYLDPITRREVTAPINTVFSSHDLRRTFTNKVFQDTKGNTALTSSMTGHKSSQAFARYRVVSNDLKKKTVQGLNFKSKRK